MTTSTKMAAAGTTASSTKKKQKMVIPVIDLSEPHQHNNHDDETVIAKQLVDAFRTIGFATLMHHGIDFDNIIAPAFSSSQDFFNLPLETKLQSKYVSHDSNRGYIAVGSETHDKDKAAKTADRKETFDMGKEGEGKGLETPWPDASLLPEFRDTMVQYFQEFDKLHLRLLKLVAIGQNMDDVNFFVDRCHEQHCNLRLLHYPELERSTGNISNDDLLVHRGATHTDYGTITLLSQDMVGGLRVQTLDGNWIMVEPVRGSIIVNVGDMLQRWTNDVLRATPHQVVDDDSRLRNNNNNNPTANIIPERYSIAFFCNANKDVLLDPIIVANNHNETPTEKKKKYPPINALEYLTQRQSATISNK